MRTPRRILIAVLLAMIASAGASSLADEMLRFKNGHSMTVRSARVEGNVVHVLMPDGGEASFPKALIKLSESGTISVPGDIATGPVNFAGRGPRGSQLIGSRRAEAMAAMNGSSSTGRRVIAQGTLNSQGGTVRQTVGFSQWGSAAIGVPDAPAQEPPRVNMADRPRRPPPAASDEAGYTTGARPAASTDGTSIEPAFADPGTSRPGVL